MKIYMLDIYLQNKQFIISLRTEYGEIICMSKQEPRSVHLINKIRKNYQIYSKIVIILILLLA